MIVGQKVRFRRPESRGTDHETLVRWRNDPSVKRLFFEEEPISLDSHLAWYDKVSQDPTQRFYVIDALVQPDPLASPCDPPLLIGSISLANIDWRNRTAEWGRFLIGHPDYLGGGYGKEAGFLLMDYAFGHLNMNKIWSDVIAGNAIVLSVLRLLGFKEEGVLRQQVFKGGRYIDVVRLGLVARDFRGLRDEQCRRLGLERD